MLTKYTETELRREIDVLLDDLQRQREPLSPPWVTHIVTRKHIEGLVGEGPQETIDRAFWRFCGYTITRKLATACINEREDPLRERTTPFGPTELELTLMQDYYVVSRDDGDIGVPTETMSSAELYAKAALYERNSVKLAEHARQLRRYAEWREARMAMVTV